MDERVTIGGTCIGTLRWGEDGDYPWAIGTFTPSPAFDAFARYFVAREGSTVRWLRDDLLAADGVPPAELRLVPVDADQRETTYLHALGLDPGGRARWQFGPEPLDDD